MTGVFGLGRSGLQVALAEQRRDRPVVVFDERGPEHGKPDVVQAAVEAHIPVVFGWNGEFPADLTTLVVNPAVRRDHPVLVAALAQGIEVIGEIEYAYRIAQAPIVAISGTNGKSTTTVMTYASLRAAGIDAVLCGNIFGSGYPEQTLTQAADSAGAHQVLVAEISSFQLEWVDRFRPAVAGITNIWEDHLDRYPSRAEYATTKRRIFNRQGEGDYAVVRAADPEVPAPRGSRVLSFGAVGEHARVEDHQLVLFGRKYAWDDLQIHEPHNRTNAAMALLAAYAALRVLDARGDSTAQALLHSAAEAALNRLPPFERRRATVAPESAPEALVDGVRAFPGLAHRMQLIGVRKGVRVINNSMCTNPDAVQKSIQAAKDACHVLMGGVNKGLDFRPLGRMLANRRHQVYLYGQDAPSIAEMLGGDWPRFATIAEAFRAATQRAQPSEVIMLSPGCASTDQFRDFRHRGEVFTNMARAWVEGS
jgi:UDP-N-acetylmuramoylalanine--D-glutamate ligase